MAIVGFDYGHGGADPGAVYKGRREADDVLKVGMKTAAIMRRHGVTVDETRTTNKTLSLRERSNFLNRKNYDYVVSFHRNAFKPEQAKGVEVFAHPQSNAKSKALSRRMVNELSKVRFVNRGAKAANFHMLRETKAYSVLAEIGFIDNTADNKLFDTNIDKIAEAIAKSLLAEMGIKYKEIAKPAPSNSDRDLFYRVVTGSFNNRKNAEERIAQLKKAGFDSFIDIYNK